MAEKKAPTKKKPAQKKKAQPKKGRPTKYSMIYVPKIAEMMANSGMTDQEMAKFLGVAESTFHLWKTKYPEFVEALKRGKEEPDDAVQAGMFKSAIGHFVDETVQQYKVIEGQEVLTNVTVTHRYIPPNTGAFVFWMKNRKGWADRQEIGIDIENDPVFVISSALRDRAMASEPPPQ